MKKLFWLFSICLSAQILYATTYDAEHIANIFYKLNADPNKPKQKVNHALGFCGNGVFIPDPNITKIIDVPMLRSKSIHAQVRYSLGGAFMDDKTKPRGMALKLNDKDYAWTLVMLNTPINFARTPEEFGKFFEVRLPGKDGKVDKEKIAKTMQEVASYRNFFAYSKQNVGITPSVANTPFYSVHTFWFKDAKNGKFFAAKWKFEPVDGVKYLSDNELKKADKHFLRQRFYDHIKKSPIEYKMYLIVANKGDITNDTTALWKGEHKQYLIGTLKIANKEDDSCNVDVYFPADLPQGIDAPKDPLFTIRNDAYTITYSRRLSY